MMPLLLIVVGSLGAAVYALVTNIYNIGAFPVIVLALAILLYIIGLVIVIKSERRSK